jgi:hypothetical protein
MPGNQGRHWEKTAENMTWTDIFGHFDGNRRETRRKLALARWKGHHGRCRAAKWRANSFLVFQSVPFCST